MQYLKFAAQRTRPSHDLVAQIPADLSHRAIIDIGCGPGNSTSVLSARYPSAQILGIDSSPNMIDAARAAGIPSASFVVADATTYQPEKPADLVFSNAALQWIQRDERIPAMKRVVGGWLRTGGVFAMQVPDSQGEGIFQAMRETASQLGTQGRVKGEVQGPFQQPQELYDELKPLCEEIDLWHTFYYHQLGGHEEIVEWAKGTGLRPFIDDLEAGERETFLSLYLQKLKAHYPLSLDGTVLLRYPRLFMIAVRA